VKAHTKMTTIPTAEPQLSRSDSLLNFGMTLGNKVLFLSLSFFLQIEKKNSQ